MSSEPLRQRDMNAQPEIGPKAGDKDFKQAAAGPQKVSYVSPSDAIMSPASKKLSDFKQKQIGKTSVPRRSLFANMMASKKGQS